MAINTTIDALRMQRYLDSNQVGLARTLQRLSSGLRVNAAVDDAAGMAIAVRMSSQIRGMDQGLRNAHDVVSLLQTGQAQLQQMVALVQRVRELGVQASSAAYSLTDRSAMEQEMLQNLDEVQRLASLSSVNGRTLFDGSQGATIYQVGANAADTLSFDGPADLRRAALGKLQMLATADLRAVNGGTGGGFQFAGTYTSVPIANMNFSIPSSPFRAGVTTTQGAVTLDYSGLQAATFKVDDVSINLNANYGSVGAVAGALRAALNIQHPGWYAVSLVGSDIRIAKTASASTGPAAPNIVALGGSTAAAFTNAAQVAGAAAVTTTNAGFSVDGHAVFLNSDYSGNDAGLVADIQGQLDATHGMAGQYQVSGGSGGISIARNNSLVMPSVGGFVASGAASFVQAAPATMALVKGDLQVQMGTGKAIDIIGNFATPEALAQVIMQKVPGLYAAVDFSTGVLKLLSSQSFTVSGAQSGSGGSLGFGRTSSQEDGSLAQVNFHNPSSATELLMRADVALDTLSRNRATLGAFENRMQAVMDGLQSGSANLSASRGRILDADYAVELAALTKHQILQQSAQAMLAQANLTQRNVLALLR